jgi:WD40 repeat protein
VSDRYFAYAQTSSSSAVVNLAKTDRLISLKNSDCSVAAYRSDEPIFSLHFVNVLDAWFLVVCSASQATILDEHCQKTVSTISSTRLKVIASDMRPLYFKGCASTSTSLALGGSTGVVCIFTAERTIKGVGFRDQAILNHSQGSGSAAPPFGAAVSAVGMLGNWLIVGDEEGNYSIWKKESTWQQVVFIGGQGLPVTAVCMNDRVSCVVFASGSFHVVNKEAGLVVFEVWAHCRWLSGATMHPWKSLLVTCGEDCFLNVWEVSVERVTLVHSKQFPNCVLTGVVTTLSDCRIAAVAYDRKELIYSAPDAR